MAQIDSYRTTMLRKREELAKLNQDLAREQAKIAPLQKKIISAKCAIERTKSDSTIKSRLSEIGRAEKSIADIQKKCSDIQAKIAQKEKEYTTADKTIEVRKLKSIKKQLMMKRNVSSRQPGNQSQWSRLYGVKSNFKPKCRGKLIV